MIEIQPKAGCIKSSTRFAIWFEPHFEFAFKRFDEPADRWGSAHSWWYIAFGPILVHIFSN